MKRCPEGFQPSDVILIPLVIAGLVLTSILERFELMPRIPRPRSTEAVDGAATHPQQEKPNA